MLELKGKLIVPSGTISESSAPITLDMEQIYHTESRLGDIRVANTENYVELMGTFNEAAHTTMKYIAKIEFELLMAKQQYDRRKAVLILDVIPEELRKREIKSSEDVRNSFLTLDEECARYKDRIDCLTAAITLLDGKVKSFVRAFNAAKSVAEVKRGSYTSLSTSGNIKNSEVSNELDLSFGDE
jgi:hypothetical protein